MRDWLQLKWRLFWAGWRANRRGQVVGALGLYAIRPGGNARDRRQHWRHPVKHSRLHLGGA